jgi:hypothetical protein
MTTTTKSKAFRNITALAVFCFTILATTFQVQKLNAQNVDQLTKKQGTDFPADFLKMDRSDPLTILVDVQNFIFGIDQAPGIPLGYVQVDVADSYARDYSELAGSSEFSVNFDPNVVDYGNSATVTKPARIGIVELKESPGGALRVGIDRGKTTLCIPLDDGTGEEDMRKLVRLIRTKDGQMAAMVTFSDREGIFSSLQPGVSERICILVPLQGTNPSGSLKFARDSEGNTNALLIVHEGMKRVKSEVAGKAAMNVTVLTPADKEVAEKMGMTMVVVN